MTDTANKIKLAFEAAHAVENGAEAARHVLALLDIPFVHVAKGVYDPGPVVGEHIEYLFWCIANYDTCDWPDDEQITTLDVSGPAAHARDFYAWTGMPTYGPGLFPQGGIALLYGPPKVGKTQWLIDRLHTWTSLDMRTETTPKEAHRLKVVFLSLESVRSVIASVEGRCRGQRERGYRYPTGARVLAPYAGDLNLTDSASISEFVDSLEPRKLPPGLKLSKDAERLRKDLSCPDVVVLDSFSRAIAGQDENSAQVMSAAVEGLQRLRDAMGARLLVVLHHTPQGRRQSERARRVARWCGLCRAPDHPG